MTQEATARVLIADDDSIMCGFCARALAGAGHAVTTAVDADGALAALRGDGPFDLLLADIQMPGLSGLELARIAREHDPAIAVVIMTGHSSPDTVYASVRRGVADYLTKPFTVEELTVVVEQALHKRQLLQESLRLRALEQLLRSSEAINAILDREQLAREIIARAREHVPSLAGYLIIYGSTDTPIQVICDPPEAALLPAGHAAAGEGLRAGRPVPVGGDAPLGALGERPLARGLAVPLRAQGEAVGALLLCDERPDFGSPGAQDILALLAHQAGNALRNAHLYGELDTAYQGLRELDRMKSEFIAIASHELRSPLAIVMGYAKMVRDRSEGDQREYAQRVLDGAERIKGIVDDMMRLRDFDRNQSVLALEPVPVHELLRQAGERLAPAAQQKGQTVTIANSAPALTVPLDREKALLVVGNLLANAIKFTPVGGQIALGAELWPHDRLAAAVGRAASNPTVRRLGGSLPAAWAVVRVSDNGIGIPRDQQQRIFERFYQVASSLTREQGGVGLGLAIVCDLASLQGGVVWVESEEGRGSTFSFALPMADG
ncbi:MAG TPA: ATP-binding protein [Chloroflexaceae bacterium]|nr:ATP-binding protein [Chloroflexaceae bacterium]